MTLVLDSAGQRNDATPSDAGRWQVRFDPAAPVSAAAGLVELWFDDSLDLSTAIHPENNDRYCLRWPEGRAEIRFDAHEIYVRPASTKVHRRNLERFTEAQILPRVLAHEGQLVLHASTVEVDGALIAFAGPSGTGKSTLAASLLSAGYRVLGDDSLQVVKKRSAHFGSTVFPGLWLLPDSVEQLFPVQRVQTRGHATKIAVEISTGANTGALRAIYVLASGETISIRRKPPSQACMAIIANSFALDPADFGRGRTKLLAAASLVEEVAVFELSYPRRYDRLDAVRNAVLRHFEECYVDAGTDRP